MTAFHFAFSDPALYGREPGQNVRETYRTGAEGVEVLVDGPAWLAPRSAWLRPPRGAHHHRAGKRR